MFKINEKNEEILKLTNDSQRQLHMFEKLNQFRLIEECSDETVLLSNTLVQKQNREIVPLTKVIERTTIIYRFSKEHCGTCVLDHLKLLDKECGNYSDL